MLAILHGFFRKKNYLRQMNIKWNTFYQANFVIHLHIQDVVTVDTLVTYRMLLRWTPWLHAGCCYGGHLGYIQDVVTVDTLVCLWVPEQKTGGQRSKVEGKLNYLLLKVTLQWQLPNIQEFGELCNNHGDIVSFYKNNTTAPVYRYSHTLSSSHPKRSAEYQ